ncbi:MAG: sensor histidine kinase [Cytophagaceae bacterium]
MNKSLNILIVEDVATDAELVVMELESANLRFQYDRVETRKAFTSYLEHNSPDVIISDYSLPTFGALEALKIRNSNHPNIPFILVTGNQTEEIAVECIKQGADDYILKSSLVRLPSAVINIIDKKQAEKEIKLVEERTRFLIEAIPQKVWTADKDGKMTYFNKLWVDYTGLSYDTLLKNDWGDIVHFEDVEKNKEIWQKAFESGEDFQFQYRLRNKYNEYRWHLSCAVAQKDQNGNPLMWLGTNTDIHDLKVVQEDLIDSRKQLEKINEELSLNNGQLKKTNNDLDNFVYTASHDLKAPISNIEGLITTLEDSIYSGVDKEEIKAIFEMIKASLQRFKNTIRDLTEISKVQNDVSENQEEIDLYEMIEDVSLSIRDQIKESQASIKMDLSGCSKIKFSRKDLKSIIYNLLSNAIKYRCQEKSPEIYIKTESSDEHLILTVKDNGLGFSEDNLTKAFSMFKRFHAHVEGSGIGLYIVKRIMDNNGGDISLTSSLGEGSEFKLFFKHPKIKSQDDSEVGSANFQ